MSNIPNNFLSPAGSTASTVVKDSYLDQNSLNSVKAMGRKNDPQALKEISKKFEAMFVQQMLKSMRDASEVFSEGNELSSSEVKFHQEMLDQQMVLNLTSGKGMGLAASMYQQMVRAYGKPPSADSSDMSKESATPAVKTINQIEAEHQNAAARKLRASQKNTEKSPVQPAPANLKPEAGIKSAIAKTAEEFIAAVKPYAEKAAAALNIKADVLLAQAALETGWGKNLIHDKQGNNTFNIFNIKATGAWQGKSVSVNSLEVKQGVTQQERADFRHYDNFLQSFNDYVDLIKNNPRYEKALAAGENSAGYAEALQKAGYATDPHYAKKIKQLLASDVIRSAVNPELQNSTSLGTREG